MTKVPARDHVLRHALDCFLRFGYDRTAMQDIASSAGLSRQGLYHHFPNKDELFSALIDVGNAATMHASEAARDKARAEGLPFAQVVGAVLHARFGTMQSRFGASPEALEFIDQAYRRCFSIVLRHAERFRALLAEMIETEVAEGRLALVDGVTPSDLAEALGGMARGVNGRLPPPRPEILLDEYTRYAALLLRGASKAV